MSKPIGGGGPLAELRAQLGMSQTQLAMESGASILAIRAVEQGLAKEIAEPILEWVTFLGLNSLDLSRRYQEWRKSFRGDAAELLERVFRGRRGHLVFRRLQIEPPGAVFRSYRRLAGISIADIVRVLGVEPRIYDGWEAGRNAPQVSRALTKTGWTGAAPFAKAVPKAASPVRKVKPASPVRPTAPLAAAQLAELSPSELAPRRCDRHSVVAYPGVIPTFPCEAGRRYRAVSEDGSVKGNVTPCAIRAANDAHFATRYTGSAFGPTEA